MNKVISFVGASILAGLVLTSCKQEAQSEAEKEPLTLEDFAMDQEAEDAAAAENETFAEAQKTKDQINARTKASEERVENLKKILECK